MALKMRTCTGNEVSDAGCAGLAQQEKPHRSYPLFRAPVRMHRTKTAHASMTMVARCIEFELLPDRDRLLPPVASALPHLDQAPPRRLVRRAEGRRDAHRPCPAQPRRRVEEIPNRARKVTGSPLPRGAGRTRAPAASNALPACSRCSPYGCVPSPGLSPGARRSPAPPGPRPGPPAPPSRAG